MALGLTAPLQEELIVLFSFVCSGSCVFEVENDAAFVYVRKISASDLHYLKLSDGSKHY